MVVRIHGYYAARISQHAGVLSTSDCLCSYNVYACACEYLCVHVCVVHVTTWCVCVYACVIVCMCVYVEAREELRYHSRDIYFIFLETGELPGLEFAKMAGCLASPRDQSASASLVPAFECGSED